MCTGRTVFVNVIEEDKQYFYKYTTIKNFLSAVLQGCTGGAVMEHLLTMMKIHKLYTGREKRSVIPITFRCLNFDCGGSAVAKV
jgi:hypothetical protein